MAHLHLHLQKTSHWEYDFQKAVPRDLWPKYTVVES